MIEKGAKTAKEEIKARFKILKKALEEREKELLSEVERAKEWKVKETRIKKEEGEHLKEKVEACLSLGRELIEKMGVEEVKGKGRAKKVIEERVTKVMEERRGWEKGMKGLQRLEVRWREEEEDEIGRIGQIMVMSPGEEDKVFFPHLSVPLFRKRSSPQAFDMIGGQEADEPDRWLSV